MQYRVVGGILIFYIQYLAMNLIKFPTFSCSSQHCEEVPSAIRWACVWLPVLGEFTECTLMATLEGYLLQPKIAWEESLNWGTF